ncbi:Crp/Fnr family transcriptional regulator [Rhodospirillaceae bacterium KN72]|uniref:Crp/Fnr family transcriptional regulator n=1 Tax=Pacificispira spongiicola TaxID=2729598 RepID=A0A7Y0E1F3_9PROT|nr:Crp/Fnr family transcriptional regulator [Pacificispira spongiicola]NMM45493.1 Crp/Fnr family transcriptional regulator [Pacificispira spongiicola]
MADAKDTAWIESFPALKDLPETERRLLVERGSVIDIPAGTTVFAPGVAAENFLLVIDGTVRVQQVSAGGREIVLYRVSGGETCIMTTSCLMAEEAYTAEGITETDVRAVAIPKTVFEELLVLSPGFRRIVFSAYANRISDVMHVVEDVAFERLDKRLAQRLLDRAGSDDIVRATQQELAAELGTAREVASRLLKEFERRGWVALTRGQVALRDRDALHRAATAE